MSPDVARARVCPRVPKMLPVSYPRRIGIAPLQATQHAHMQGFCASPLTDSNRRPPPYHGGFVPRRRVGGGRLPGLFCLHLPGYRSGFVSVLMRPEHPRESLNLSPGPVPRPPLPVFLTERTFVETAYSGHFRTRPSERAHRGPPVQGGAQWNQTRPRFAGGFRTSGRLDPRAPP